MIVEHLYILLPMKAIVLLDALKDETKRSSCDKKAGEMAFCLRERSEDPSTLKLRFRSQKTVSRVEKFENAG